MASDWTSTYQFCIHLLCITWSFVHSK